MSRDLVYFAYHMASDAKSSNTNELNKKLEDGLEVIRETLLSGTNAIFQMKQKIKQDGIQTSYFVLYVGYDGKSNIDDLNKKIAEGWTVHRETILGNNNMLFLLNRASKTADVQFEELEEGLHSDDKNK